MMTGELEDRIRNLGERFEELQRAWGELRALGSIRAAIVVSGKDLS